MSARPNTRTTLTSPEIIATVIRGHLEDGYRLVMVAAHEDDDVFRVIYVLARARDGRRREFVVRTPKAVPKIPSMAGISFPLGRFEREARDLYGIIPVDHPLPARLVRHSHWPQGYHPMLRDADPHPVFEHNPHAKFVDVHGTGVYEIPVGPIHAGLIEPGHFRFYVVGETILRMKARLWWVQRGVEKLFEGKRPADAVPLAERVSGDTAVGHSTAFAMAVEEAADIDVPEQALLVRALLLELERMHNHVADLGMLANDVAFGAINAHALRLRERLLRINKQVTGHRLLRGAISIGGAQVLSLPNPDDIADITSEINEFVDATLGHSTVRDRFNDTAILHRDAALEIGTLGYVARASGVDIDARRDFPFVDLGRHFEVCTETTGDVMARYLVRHREINVSSTLIADLCARLNRGTGVPGQPDPVGEGAGLSLVEGWRGTIAHRVELAADGSLSRVKIVDPSFFNWPALSIALADTIVPDFPLANKSFNQSYAGNDL